MDRRPYVHFVAADSPFTEYELTFLQPGTIFYMMSKLQTAS